MDETPIKITFTKNMSKQNFNSTLSVAIDSNVNIKTILDTHAYLFDEKIECVNGKAILTGKIGLKVLYIDVDGISNTITDSQAISENIIDSAITTDSFINISNRTIIANVLSTDGVLKVSCETSLTPVLYFNIPLSNKSENQENIINKKSEVLTSTITNYIDSNFIYTTSFETKDSISKILCHDAYFAPTNVKAQDESIHVEGKLHSRLLFETGENDEIKRKEICDTFNISTDFKVDNIKENAVLDINFMLDKSKEEISTEIEDDNSIVTIQNTIKVSGVALTEMNVDVVDDMFSCDHELELSLTEREFVKKEKTESFEDKVYGEITLSDKETAIDEVISNLNISPEITNIYIKNETLQFEGIISSHLTYVDENKDCVHKLIEIPFVINSKVTTESLEITHADMQMLDCKVKVKRGTIIELEYFVEINVHTYSKNRKQMIDNVILGKPIDFSNYDYQIFIAKPSETIWELCKRIKIAPEKLNETNKDLPLVMNGGEKIVIKR